MSLRVRSTAYRDRPGYLICGRPLGNVARLQIFCRTLPIARLIQRLGNDKHIAAYGTGSVERGQWWARVLDGLLMAEKRAQ